MENIFNEKICPFCENFNCIKCKKDLSLFEKNGVQITRCNNYVKNNLKIIPYQEPLTITAKRDYVCEHEI